MKIRRYLAKDAQEAMLKVKMDLGNDALIINTRKVAKKGIQRFFSRPMVEVTAAIDDNYVRTPASTQNILKEAASAYSQFTGGGNAATGNDKIVTLENKVNNMEDLLKKIYDQFQQKNSLDDHADADLENNQAMKVGRIFYNNLLKNEVDADVAKSIIEKVAKKTGDNSGVNETASALISEIAQILGKPSTIREPRDGKPVVAIFIGPTGVGKTTTLAKLAANFLINEKKKVGLITADTYRIAAVEQLRTYSEILGIPLSVAYSANDVSEAIKQHSEKDIILIDTAGRSHNNKSQFEELKELIAAASADEVFLVLSSTTSSKCCRDILNKYSFLGDYKLIFTKTDEAPLAGIILNTICATGRKLSYITNGQNVPDDIEVANVAKISKSLIGSIANV